MSESEIGYEIPFPESFDIVSLRDGQAVAIDLHTLDPDADPANPTPVEVRVWLTLPQAAKLAAQLGYICRQFGEEPPSLRDTKQ